MICPHCGYEYNQPNTYCSSCGNTVSAPQPTPTGPNPMENVLFPLLRDPLFFVVCILTSVAAGLAFILGQGIPVLEVFFAVFLWIIYTAATKNELSLNGLRGVSGTLYAVYIVQMITSIFIIVSGALTIPAAFFISKKPEYVQELLETILAGDIFFNWLLDTTQATLTLLTIVFGILCIVIGLVQLLFSLNGWRPIHRFAQSLYKSFELSIVDVRFANEAQRWLMILGIFRVASAFFSVIQLDFTSFIPTVITSAVMILCSLLLKKHKQQNN